MLCGSEKHYLAIKTQASRKVTLFSEIKVDNQNKSNTNFGYRVNFSEGLVQGMLNTNLKAVMVYRHMLDFGMLTF